MGLFLLVDDVLKNVVDFVNMFENGDNLYATDGDATEVVAEDGTRVFDTGRVAARNLWMKG